MGSLSQEYLDAGDPIELRKEEAAIEKIEPTIKGFQKGTQKSENIRLGNDKKYKELLKSINSESQEHV